MQWRKVISVTKYETATWHSYLRRGIDTYDSQLVERALEGLARIRSPRSLQLIRESLRAGFPDAAARAARAFLPDHRAIEILEEALPSLWSKELDRSVSALSRVRSPGLAASLLAMLESGDRMQAERALRQLPLIDRSALKSWCETQRASRATATRQGTAVLNAVEGHLAALDRVARFDAAVQK